MLYLLLQCMVKALTGLLALFALVAAGALFLRQARVSALARLKKGVLLALLICAVVATDWAQKGEAGGIGMQLTLTVHPLYVSFSNLKIEEVPCYSIVLNCK